MSSDATPTMTPISFPPPPSGLNYIAAIKPSLTFLMIGTVWSGILLPLLVALFFFSTKESRRRPIFIMNALSLISGLFMGILNAAVEINTILSPLDPFSLTTAVIFSVVSSFTPLLVESILVVRLMAVYPFSRTPTRKWCWIFIPVILIKLGRLGNNINFTVEYIILTQSAQDSLSTSPELWSAHPNAKIEWILQVIDNTATSVLFIVRLKSGLGTPGLGTYKSNNSHDSYTAKLKALFWIAASNFVFPVILSILQLILLFRDPEFLKGTYIFITNDYFEIVGVLLATVWASSSHWTDQNPTTITDLKNVNGDGSGAPRFVHISRSEGSSTGDFDTFTGFRLGTGEEKHERGIITTIEHV